MEKWQSFVPSLSQRWPDLFLRRPQPPLAIGIHEQLIAALGEVDETILSVVLMLWTSRYGYKAALARGEARRNLDGTDAGFPTAQQQAFAARCAEICEKKAKAQFASVNSSRGKMNGTNHGLSRESQKPPCKILR